MGIEPCEESGKLTFSPEETLEQKDWDKLPRNPDGSFTVPVRITIGFKHEDCIIIRCDTCYGTLGENDETPYHFKKENVGQIVEALSNSEWTSWCYPDEPYERTTLTWHNDCVPDCKNCNETFSDHLYDNQDPPCIRYIPKGFTLSETRQKLQVVRSK